MEKLDYRLIRSARKSVAIQISPAGEVIVRAPQRMALSDIDRFVSEKRGWIEKHLPKGPTPQKLTETELRELARKALEIIPERVKYFAPLMGVTYGNITIRNQRTRWGSCTAEGNLNFNCLLMLAPAEVLDYVVVHELCHRKEMNHSAKFWAEVERIIPNWKEHRRWLKENGQQFIGRM